jgi:hypothetical protein
LNERLKEHGTSQIEVYFPGSFNSVSIGGVWIVRSNLVISENWRSVKQSKKIPKLLHHDKATTTSQNKASGDTSPFSRRQNNQNFGDDALIASHQGQSLPLPPREFSEIAAGTRQGRVLLEAMEEDFISPIYQALQQRGPQRRSRHSLASPAVI